MSGIWVYDKKVIKLVTINALNKVCICNYL